ncbi:putative bifunctional diguanylate cyclase/phosphodiesterase [Actinospongicola halichondriae]|uniref:putative bifunctional diguanylate cyclase/phosphodiesterase n=1 Tax=Actinospongicola halichondriae TaxID=3236844 RepID=UPI003D445BE5
MSEKRLAHLHWSGRRRGTALRIVGVVVVPLGLLLASTLSSAGESTRKADSAEHVEAALTRLAAVQALEVALEHERLDAQLNQWLGSGGEDTDSVLQAIQTLAGDPRERTDEAIEATRWLDDQLQIALERARDAVDSGARDRTVSTRFDQVQDLADRAAQLQHAAVTAEVVALGDDTTVLSLDRANHLAEATTAHIEFVTGAIAVWTSTDLGANARNADLTELRGRWSSEYQGLAAPVGDAGGRMDRAVDTTLLLDDGTLAADAFVDEEIVRAVGDGLARQRLLESAHDDAVAVVADAAGRRRTSEQANARANLLLALAAILSSMAAVVVSFMWTLRINREQHRLTAELAARARVDGLTGEANRPTAMAEVERLLRTDRGTIAVAFFDLDRFKKVNDGYGHPVGDLLLRGAAARARRVVGPDGVVARFGGDEFLAAVPNLATDADAEIFADTLHRALQVPYQLDDSEVHTGVSMGLATSGDIDGADELVKRAMLAADAAKSSRGSRVTYTAAFHAALEDESRLHAQLIEALAEDKQLEIHLQPIVGTASGRVHEVEALIRWLHPVLGPVDPVDFIPAAERSGVIRGLDLRMLRLCAAMTESIRQDAAVPDLRIAVNVSGTTLLDRSFAERALEIIAEAGGSPADLVIEVTETAFLADLATVAENLSRLRNAGVAVAIDDFGTGYTSIAQIRRLPVDILKIDRSLVDTNDGGGATLVQVVTDLARALGLTTVIEGIEDETTHALAASVGCDRAQGRWICPPVPARDVAAAIRDLHRAQVDETVTSGRTDPE